jgi:hypothetical protein
MGVGHRKPRTQPSPSPLAKAAGGLLASEILSHASQRRYAQGGATVLAALTLNVYLFLFVHVTGLQKAPHVHAMSFETALIFAAKRPGESG